MAAALFGASTPLSKALLRDFSPFQLAGLLYLGAALGVAPSLFGAGQSMALRRSGRQNVLRLAGAILFGGVLGPVFLLFGLRAASSASVSMWLNLELIATAVLGHVLFRDRLGKFGWIGTAGTVGACVLLSLHEGMAGQHAGLLVAFACVCWGFDNHFTALIDGISPAQSTFWKGLVAGAVNLSIGLVASPWSGGVGVTVVALVVGAFTYGVSIALYITAAQQIGATRGQMIFASAPFFGVVLAATFLGESIFALQYLSAGLLVLSLACLFRDRHTHVHYHEPMRHVHLHRHDDGHHLHVHEGKPSSLLHSHWHEHKPMTHAHPHWPDLHHRHHHHD